jgi:hypothetical protein
MVLCVRTIVKADSLPFVLLHHLVIAALIGATAVAAAPAPAAQALLSSKDFTGWLKPTGEWTVASAVSLGTASATNFVVAPGMGIIVNGLKGKTINLVTEAEFGDVEAHIEFCIPRRSNSGIYFMGRYEVQVYDSFGVEKDQYPGIECAGIYGRWINKQNVEGHSPRVNASRPPGQWQAFDVTFRAPRFDASGKKIANAKFVKVVHNGQVVHADVEVTGPTRAARFEDEKPSGPLMLQGDHGPVAYRNLQVKPVALR